MALNDLAVPVQQFGQEDLAELGASLSAQGWTALETRALITQIQQIATQTALSMIPQILEQVRLINASRLTEIYTRIRMLSAPGGFIQRQRVLEIVQGVTSTPPNQR